MDEPIVPDGSHRVSFDVVGDELIVTDEIEGVEMAFTVSNPTDLQSALTDLFLFPVDDAVSLRTDRIEVGPVTNTGIRRESGEHLGQFHTEAREFERDTYYVHVQGRTKVYLRLPEAILTGVHEDNRTGDSQLRIDLEEPRTVAVGARSSHSVPEAVMTVPDDPRALIEALPYLASSIKEFSPERSWSTLRDHPPAIEEGSELEIPARLAAPDTGVTVAVPPTFADVYRVAPLVYYLGADVVAADEPELQLANGYVESLRHESRTLAESVDRIRARCLLLDSLVRVNGYFSVPRLEYDEMAQELPFYPPNLYDASLSEQLTEYLEVNRSDLEPYLPEWSSVAVLRDEIDDAAYLPHLLNTLSSVRVGSDQISDEGSSPLRIVGYAESDPPPGTARLSLDAFENALDRQRPTPEDVNLGFLAASAERADALRTAVSQACDDRGISTDSITVLDRPTRNEVDTVLGADFEFLYSDLPTTDRGFACSDGYLHPGSLTGSVPDLVVTTEATTPEFETALIREGAVAALLANEPLSPGTIARVLWSLLRGQSVWTSTKLVDFDETHRFVGDASQSLVVLDSGQFPVLVDVESHSETRHVPTFRSLPPAKPGGILRDRSEETSDAYQLAGGGPPQPFSCSTDELVDVLDDDYYVARINGRPYYGGPEPKREFVQRSARQSLDTDQSI